MDHWLIGFSNESMMTTTWSFRVDKCIEPVRYQIVCTPTSSKQNRSTSFELGTPYSSKSVAYFVLFKVKEAYEREPASNPADYNLATFLDEIIEESQTARNLLYSQRQSVSSSSSSHAVADNGTNQQPSADSSMEMTPPPLLMDDDVVQRSQQQNREIVSDEKLSEDVGVHFERELDERFTTTAAAAAAAAAAASITSTIIEDSQDEKEEENEDNFQHLSTERNLGTTTNIIPVERKTTYNAAAQMCIVELFAHFDRKLGERLIQRREQRMAAAAVVAAPTLTTIITTNNDDDEDNRNDYISVDKTNCWNFIVPAFNQATADSTRSSVPLSDIEVATKDVERVANVQQARRIEVLQRLEDNRWVLERFLGAIADPDLARNVRLGIEEHQRRLYETQGEELLLSYRQRRLELGFDVEKIPEEIEAEYKFRSKYKQFILKKYRPKRIPMSLQNKWKRLLPRGKEQRKEEEEERRLWRLRKTQLQQLVIGNSRMNQFRSHLAQRNAPIDAPLDHEENQVGEEGESTEVLTEAIESDELQHRKALWRIRQSLIEDDECSIGFDDEDVGYDEEEEVCEPDDVELRTDIGEEMGGKNRGLLQDVEEDVDWKRSIIAADRDDATMLAREIAALTRLMDAENAGEQIDMLNEEENTACANKQKRDERNNEKNPLSYPALKENIRRAMALYMQKIPVKPMAATLDGDLIVIPATAPLIETNAVSRDGLSASQQLLTRIGGVMPPRGSSVIRNTSRSNPPPQNAPDVIKQTISHRISQAVVPERTSHRMDPLLSKNKKPLFYKETPPLGVLDALAKMKVDSCIPPLTDSHVTTQTRGVLWGDEWTEKTGIVVSDGAEESNAADAMITSVLAHELPEEVGHGCGFKGEEGVIIVPTIESATSVTASNLSPPLSLSHHEKREQETREEKDVETMSLSGRCFTDGSKGGVQEPLRLVVGDDNECFDDSDHEGAPSPPSHPHPTPYTHPELVYNGSEADINSHYPTNSVRLTNSTISLPSFPSSSRYGNTPAVSMPIRRVSFQSNEGTEEEKRNGRNLSSRPRPPVTSRPSRIPYQRDRDVTNRDGEWVENETEERVGVADACTKVIQDTIEGNQESTTDTSAVLPRNIRQTIPRDSTTARDVGGGRQRATGKQFRESVTKSGQEVRVGVTFQVPNKVPKGLYLIPMTNATPTGGGTHPRGARLVSSHRLTAAADALDDHHLTDAVMNTSHIITTMELPQGAKKKMPTINVFKDNVMQALALVRNAPERDRDTEVHIAAASIATRPVLATHKGPAVARKSFITPPPPPPPPPPMCIKYSNNDTTYVQPVDAGKGTDGQPQHVRDDSCQVHQHAELRLLKGKHKAGMTPNKAGLGSRHSRKCSETMEQNADSVRAVDDKQEALVVSKTLTSIAAAAIEICTMDEKESSSHKQSLITSNQEVTAATTYRPSTSSIDGNADASNAKQMEQHTEKSYSSLPELQENEHTSMDIAWQHGEGEAVASEEGKSENLSTSVLPDHIVHPKQQQQQQYASPLVVPSYDVVSLPHTDVGNAPITTTSSLLAALSIAFSGATWQLPSVSSESTIGTASNPSHPLPHYHLDNIHHQDPSPFSFDGIDTRANIHHHKSHRPNPHSTKRPPMPSVVRAWLSSKHKK